MRKTWTMLMLMVGAVTLNGSCSAAAGLAWQNDLEQAKKIAAEKKLPILADFTGSDWCPWCVKLDREVFSTEAFAKYAQDNLVLLVLDFPRGKKQDPKVAERNEALLGKYGVEGFPTVLIMDAGGKELGRLGYERGGPKAYVELIKGIVPKPAPTAATPPAPTEKAVPK